MKKSAKATSPAATTTQSSAPVQPVTLPARQKQQTARDVIASNVQLLIEQFEAGPLRRSDRIPHRRGTIPHLLRS